MQLIKIKFIAWRNQRKVYRSSDLQRKLDAWEEREDVLRNGALRVQQVEL